MFTVSLSTSREDEGCKVVVVVGGAYWGGRGRHLIKKVSAHLRHLESGGFEATLGAEDIMWVGVGMNGGL